MLDKYLRDKDDLYAGRTPTDKDGLITVGQLCNEFLRHCRAKVNFGEMVERTLRDYTAVIVWETNRRLSSRWSSTR